jgi:uncharacterized YigZ family protein
MKADSYLTILKESEGEFKEKGSKFIAYALPFTNIDNLKPYLEIIKAKNPKARHFCFAYKIGIGNDNFRTNDDGEPAGSAGKPILNAILSKNISDILIVVVRYFGGTLLGVSGLINAYKSASLLAISNGKTETRLVFEKFILKYNFEKTNEIMRIIKEFEIKILAQNYTDKCETNIEVRLSQTTEIISKIENLRYVEVEKIP